MPNTLVHLGLQGLATRATWRGADLAWIYAGCVIPDLPWILRRIAPTAMPAVDLFDLYLHTAVQGTFFFCIILSAAVAVLARDSRRAFLLLAVSSLLHLLLDTIEIKWGNGVHLFAPFSWRLTSLGWVWPESGWIHVLTAIGLGAVLFQWRAAVQGAPLLRRASAGRMAAAAILAAVWFAAPRVWMDAIEAAGTYGVTVLRDRESRTGKTFEFDRAPLVHGETEDAVIAFDGSRIVLEGYRGERDGQASVRGTFTAPDRIRVDQIRVHPDGVRDVQTVAGLALAVLVVGLRLARKPEPETNARAA